MSKPCETFSDPSDFHIPNYFFQKTLYFIISIEQFGQYVSKTRFKFSLNSTTVKSANGTAPYCNSKNWKSSTLELKVKILWKSRPSEFWTEVKIFIWVFGGQSSSSSRRGHWGMRSHRMLSGTGVGNLRFRDPRSRIFCKWIPNPNPRSQIFKANPNPRF